MRPLRNEIFVNRVFDSNFSHHPSLQGCSSRSNTLAKLEIALSGKTPSSQHLLLVPVPV
jgi:hypothetical protein